MGFDNFIPALLLSDHIHNEYRAHIHPELIVARWIDPTKIILSSIIRVMIKAGI